MKVKRAVIMALVVFALGAMGVLAAMPNVRSVSGGLIPVVDGNPSEWQITPTNATNPDWFACLNTGSGGGNTNCTGATGDLFLRFACAPGGVTGTLYVLMLADRGQAYATNDPADNWINFNSNTGAKLVNIPGSNANATGVDLNTGPYGGYEAAIYRNNSGTPLAPNTTYTIVFHSNMGGTTSGTGAVSVADPSCTASAVSLSSMSAQSVDSGMGWSMVGLGALGLMTLGGVLFVIARKR